MFDDLYIRIRWRWLAVGTATVAMTALSVAGVHKWQMTRIKNRVLVEARQLAETGSTVAAEERYAAYLTLDRHSAEAQEEYARLILSQPRTVDNDLTVMNLLDSAIRNGSSDTDTVREFVRVAIRLNRFGAAKVTLDSLDLARLNDPELWSARGLCCLRKGEFSRAEAAWQAALEVDEQFTAAWQGLVELTEATEGLSAAVAMADQMLTNVPGADGHAVKARLLAKQNDIAAAGESFRMAASTEGHNEKIAQEFASFIMYQVPPTDDMNREMVQTAYDALQNSVGSIDYMTSARLADLAHRLKNTEDAVAHYQKCLELKPGDPFAIGRTVELMAEAGQFADAHDMLDSLSSFRAIALLRNTLRAKLLADQGEFRKASDLLEDTIHTAGDIGLRQKAYFLLVECLWKQQRYERATVFGKELLTLTGGSDDARAQLIESQVQAGQLALAVEDIQCFHNPETYMNRCIATLIDKAVQEDQMVRLNRYIDQARSLRTSSSVPVIFDAHLLAGDGRMTEAVQLLARAAAENPDAPEYWGSLTDLKRQFSDGSELCDKDLKGIADVVIRVQHVVNVIDEDPDRGLALLKNYVDTMPDSLTPLRVTADVMDHLAGNTGVARKVLSGLHAQLAVGVKSHGTDAVPLVERVFIACEYDEHAFQLLSSAVAQSNDRAVLQRMCHRIGVDSKSDVFAGERIRRQIKDGTLVCSDIGKEILLAELDAVESDPEAAIERLQRLLRDNPDSEAAAASLLRIGGCGDAFRPELAEIGFRLHSLAPDDPQAALALSCGLRSAQRYAESVHYAIESFALKQDPVYLLHAAYTQWMADRIDSARSLLRFAFRIGLTEERLHRLDRQLLQRLKNAPELQQTTLSRSSHTTDGSGYRG